MNKLFPGYVKKPTAFTALIPQRKKIQPKIYLLILKNWYENFPTCFRSFPKAIGTIVKFVKRTVKKSGRNGKNLREWVNPLFMPANRDYSKKLIFNNPTVGLRKMR
jgi:hypothetical protein